jgi:hypothetical protein
MSSECQSIPRLEHDNWYIPVWLLKNYTGWLDYYRTNVLLSKCALYPLAVLCVLYPWNIWFMSFDELLLRININVILRERYIYVGSVLNMIIQKGARDSVALLSYRNYCFTKVDYFIFFWILSVAANCFPF